MIAKLKPYAEMQNSGVEWLGEVPAHWEVRRLGQIGSFSKGRGGSKEDKAPHGIPCVRYGDLYTTHQYFIQCTKSFLSSKTAKAYTPIKFGEVLFAASGETIDEIGKSAANLLRRDARCGGDVILFRPHRKIEARYLGFALDCRPAAMQKATMGRGITIIHIYPDQLKRLGVALPSVSEQTSIARFLDHADRRIQRYIRAKETLIELLEEQKQAIIHEAVTGQIDVRTSKPYPAYKDSTVEWLASVPSHWETRRSKRVFRPRKEWAKPDDIQLSATQAYGVIAQADYEKRVGRKVVRISQHLEKRRHVEVDDFVISMRSFQGGLERAWARGCIRSSYVVLRAVDELTVGYFEQLFKSASYINALRSTANFIRDGQDLNFENFCGVDLPIPPSNEQRRIAEVVNAYVEKTSDLVAKTRRQVKVLDEYRARLIADVVTGKLDVREAAAALPEVVSLANDDDVDHSLATGDAPTADQENVPAGVTV